MAEAYRPGRALIAYAPDQARDPAGSSTGGQFASDSSDQSASQNDEEAKALYAQMINMTPDQRKQFLAGLNDDQLTRLGKFASTGKEAKGPIADIKNAVGSAMKGRGLNPGNAGLKEKPGKKGKSGRKKSSGGGSKGGGGKSSGGGGGSKKSGGSKSSGSGKSSSSKSTPAKKPATKPAAKPATKKPTPPPPSIAPTKPTRPSPPPVGGSRRRPGTNPVAPLRSSGMADWNRTRWEARGGR